MLHCLCTLARIGAWVHAESAATKCAVLAPNVSVKRCGPSGPAGGLQDGAGVYGEEADLWDVQAVSSPQSKGGVEGRFNERHIVRVREC